MRSPSCVVLAAALAGRGTISVPAAGRHAAVMLRASRGRRGPPPQGEPAGFGALPRRSKPREGALGSLEAKLRREHAASCEAAERTFIVASREPDDDDAGGSDARYSSGWHAHLAPADAASPGNEPYGTDELLLRSRAPLLPPDECAELIRRMEAHGAEHGWDGRYPIPGHTHEVKVSDMPGALALLNDRLGRGGLLRACAEPFGLSPAELRVNEALVVKYDAASGHNALPVHVDFSLLTLNAALSDQADYAGGGTWFEHTDEVIRSACGEGLLHAGGLPHCGVPVSSGTRYVLVLFLLSTTAPMVGGRLQAIGAAAGAKPVLGGGVRAPRDLELSCACLERALALNPSDRESWSQLGHNKWHAGDLGGAERCFLEAVKRSGGRDFAALRDCAAVQRAAGEPARALETARAASALGPPPGPLRTAEALAARQLQGMALVDLRRHEEAGLVFESIIDAEPQARDAWSALGLCMAELNQPEAALACQRQVVALASASS